MMIRFAAVLAMVAGFLVLGGGTAAHACKCVVREPAELVRDADVVFTGTVTDVRVDEPMQGGGQVTATLRADRVIKGPREAVFVVTTRADGAACGYAFGEGTRHLVHAERQDGALTTSLCSGNQVLASGGTPRERSATTRPGEEPAGTPGAGEEPRTTGAGTEPRATGAGTEPTARPQAGDGGVPGAVRVAGVLAVAAALTWMVVRVRRRRVIG